MEKYLPGSAVMVTNITGAGLLIGTTALYRSKADGLTFGTFNRAVGVLRIFGAKGVRFDFKKFEWLGTASSELYNFFVSSSKHPNLDDVLKAKRTKIAAS